MGTDERIERARLLYERFVFGGEASVLAAAEWSPKPLRAVIANTVSMDVPPRRVTVSWEGTR